jgi:hypothetical protein
MNLAEELAQGVWYAEGATHRVAQTVLRQPAFFEDLFECLLSEDVGTCKRAAMALEAVSVKRPDLFELYHDILLTELESERFWHVRFRRCSIMPRLKLNRHEFKRAVAALQALAEHPKTALAVKALGALSQLALRDDELHEETIWLVEHKQRTGGKAMQARCRQMLPLLYGARK